MQLSKKILPFALCLIGLIPASQAFATLEEDKASYEERAREAREKAGELSTRINTVSEEKRVLDAEVDEAVSIYNDLKARLDEINADIAANEEKLAEAEEDFQNKRNRLGTRVRDIYINGQISYLDMLFGAGDFRDFLTRMDLLKRVVKHDKELVDAIAQRKAEIEAVKVKLEADRAEQEPQVEKAKAAKDIMLQKQRKRQELLDRMMNDKAVYDRQYDELMAASKQVERMIKEREAEAARQSAASSYSMQSGSGNGSMIWPISGPITSEFGWRTHPIFGRTRFHSGIDIGGDYGQHVHAAAAGVVSYSGWISGYGNTVIIDHGGGVSSLYGHNQSLNVSVGQHVAQGQVIAFVGSTGNSTGPHCHFEVRKNGTPVSPYGYL